MTLAILVFCLVFAICAWVVAGALLWNQERSLRRCAPVPAVIVSNAILSQDSPGAEEGPRTVYYPLITYEMTVGGARVTGDQLYPSGERSLYNTPAEAQRVADQFPLGKAVQAFADPADPSRCYLIAKRNSTWWIFVIVGTAVAFMGVANYLTKGSRFNP